MPDTMKTQVKAEDVDEGEDKKVRGPPLHVICRLCKEIYKRAAKLPCCKSSACRNCAVKQVAKIKKCWNPKCEKPATSADIVNDDQVRAKVEKYHENRKKRQEGLKTGEILKCSVCKEICKRAVTLPCCGTAACRGCAVKKITGSRSCWVENCGKDGLSGEELVNDEDLRKAVEDFKANGIVDAEQERTIYRKKVVLAMSTKIGKKKKGAKSEQSRAPPKNKENKSPAVIQIPIWVSNLPGGTTAEEVNDSFNKFGQVTEVQKIKEGLTAVTILAESVDCANKIMQEEGIVIKENKLKIEFGKHKEEYALHVSGMKDGTTKEDLEKLLNNYGEIKEVKFTVTKPWALVTFKFALGTRKFLNDRSNHEVNGTKVLVKLAWQKKLKAAPEKEVSKADTPAPDDKILCIRGPFTKSQKEDLNKFFGKFGRITESKIEKKKMSLKNRKDGKVALGDGELTFAKAGSVKHLASMVEIEFEGMTIRLKKKGDQFKSKLDVKAKKEANLPKTGIKMKSMGGSNQGMFPTRGPIGYRGMFQDMLSKRGSGISQFMSPLSGIGATFGSTYVPTFSKNPFKMARF